MDRFFVDRVRLSALAISARIRAALLLDRRPLPSLLGALTPRRSSAVPIDVAERAIADSERLFERLGVVPDTCLYRSLARYAVLRRAGHPARFVMGLDPTAKDIEGHAWVELAGEPAFETLDPGLAVTFAYPGHDEEPPPHPSSPS